MASGGGGGGGAGNDGGSGAFNRCLIKDALVVVLLMVVVAAAPANGSLAKTQSRAASVLGPLAAQICQLYFPSSSLRELTHSLSIDASYTRYYSTTAAAVVIVVAVDFVSSI